MASKVLTGLPGWIGDTTLFEKDGTFYTVVSYTTNKELSGWPITETLAYETDIDGRVLRAVPLLESNKIEDHQKFIERLE